MSTIVGRQSSVIVVDDPIGCVAPSDGVEIIGKSVMPRHLARQVEAFKASVFDRCEAQEPRRGKSMVIKPTGQEKAPKQRLKGLRP